MNKYTLIFLLLGFICGCKQRQKESSDTLQVVTTTTMLTDLLEQIGGKHVRVQGLMGTGVDPHLYKASEGDVNKLVGADVIFYNGLHLEGKLEEVFEQMRHTGVQTVAVADAIDNSKLISSENFASSFDPHIWFDIQLWQSCAQYVGGELTRLDAKNAADYARNTEVFIQRLSQLEQEVKQIVAALDKEKRILVTAHDAFHYFGRAYGFDVVGLQGLSTATEAGVQDVQRLAAYIIKHQVKAIFVESSVPQRTIEALGQAVKNKGHEVSIGGTLYSDALGNPGTSEGRYIGMFQYNVKTIVQSLL